MSTIFINSFLQAAEPSLLTDLVAYWNLNESAGVRNDSVGLLDLSDINTVGSDAGVVGNSALFVAANSERLENPTASLLDISSDVSFEVNLWAYLDTLGSRNIIVTGTLSSWDIWLYVQSNKPSMRIGGLTGGTIEAPAGLTAMSINTWYNISFRYDADVNQVGIRVNDSEEVTSNVTAGTPANNGDGLHISPSVFGRVFWDGRIDEIGFWKNRILTADERTALYSGGAGTTYPF